MPIKPNSFVPELVQQIFAKYYLDFEKQRQNNTFTNKNKEFIKSYKQLFIELDTIFGDEFKSALRLLDEQIITIYTTDKGIHEIVEITEGRNAKRVVKLFSDINYCQCSYFTKNVLQIDIIETEQISSSSKFVTSTPKTNRYTCQHVLALRLAKLLQAPCIRTEILPEHKFNFVLKQINPSENNSDILDTIAKHMN